MTDHILVFGAGYDIPARIRAAGKAAGRETVTTIMCWPSHLPKMDDTEEHARVVVVSPSASNEEWITLVCAIHAVQPVTRIGSFYDDCRPQAAVAAQVLGLPMHSPEVVELVSNKHLMRRRLAEKGLEHTPSEVVGSAEEVRRFAKGRGYPCVVKPLAGEASKGVSILRRASEATSAYRRAAGTGADGRVIVEEYFGGPQFSVESFSERREHVVVAVTRKYSDSASLVELGHVIPAPLEPEQSEAISAHVIGALDALEVEYGPTHTEIILTSLGPRVIETHLRTGGDEIWNLVTGATGIDLIEYQLRQVLGGDVLADLRATLASRDSAPRCEAIWYAGSPDAGTLVEIEGVDAALPPGVTVEVLRKPGAQLAGLQESDSRLAQARSHAATAEEAVSLARSAIEGLTFVTRVAPAHSDLI